MPDMMIQTHAKFAPLDFMNREIIGKHRFFFTQTEHPLYKYSELQNPVNLLQDNFRNLRCS